MIITEIQYFFSKIIRFQAIFKDTVEFTCALEFKISSQRFLNFTEKRIDYAKAEEGLKTTPNSECALNALAIDNPVKYARLYLDGTIQMWIDAEDSLVSLRGIFLPIVFFHLATFNCHMNITAISAYSHCGSLY